MSVSKKRVEIQLELREYAKLQELAAKKKKSIAWIVREAINTAYQVERRREKEEAVRKLTSLQLDLPEWEKLEKEIEGYHEER
jgi:hypothetical protein